MVDPGARSRVAALSWRISGPVCRIVVSPHPGVAVHQSVQNGQLLRGQIIGAAMIEGSAPKAERAELEAGASGPSRPCSRTAVAEWLGPSSLCALRPRQDCFGGRHPNTNAKTTIATSVAKMTTWMMSPLVMVDRVAANERDPGREVLNRGLHRPPRPPGQTAPELSPAVMAKLG